MAFKIIAAPTWSTDLEVSTTGFSLRSREKLSSCIFSERVPESLKKPLLEASRYIGTVYSTIGVGTGCLLDNGTILTALHTVCDIDTLFKTGDVKNSMARQDNIWVDFIGLDGRLTSIKVRGIQNHGLSILNSSASLPSSFDFALLELEVNPKEIIGEGLSFDKKNYFGNASRIDPPVTYAISRGLEHLTADGIANIQYIDASKNIMLETPYYQIVQLSNHQTEFSDSGMGILSYNTHSKKFEIYGLNLGIERNSGLQKGIKSQDILLHIAFPKLENLTISTRPFDRYSMFLEPHGFRTKHNNLQAREAQKYLSELKAAFNKSNLSAVSIPKFLTDITITPTYSSHQMTHLGMDSSKTRFFVFTNDTDPHFRAIANIIQKALSQIIKQGDQERFYPAIRRVDSAAQHTKPTKDMTFYVDLGFDVGNCRKCKTDTNWVYVEDAVGGTYHFYPSGIPNRGDTKPRENDVWVDLNHFLSILLT